MVNEIAANKKILQNFFDQLSANNYDLAFKDVDEGVVWWVPGTLAFSGEKTKMQYFAIARSIQASFPNGFQLKVMSMLGEGDQVAVEVESHGIHRNGRVYNNKYHFLFQMGGGKILRVKEYMDTQHLAQLIAQ